MKIVVLDGYAANPGDMSWDDLKNIGDTTIYERTMPGQVIERAADAEIILTNKTVITQDHINNLARLKYIGVMATGYNIVDIDAAKKKNIVVTNIPAYSTQSVAQMVFAHILNITQQVKHYSDEVHNGRWTTNPDFCYWDTPLIELSGLKMGIIGFGQTGSATARIACGFGMDVSVFTSKAQNQLPPGVHKASIESIFKDSDIVSLHCPLTDTTRGMVNAERLNTMKKTAILINTARGALVNEQDLADALNNNKIYAAGVDVLSTEPPRADNPLLKIKNCYITPHIAWATHAARIRLMSILIANIKSFVSGNPVNNVAV